MPGIRTLRCRRRRRSRSASAAVSEIHGATQLATVQFWPIPLHWHERSLQLVRFTANPYAHWSASLPLQAALGSLSGVALGQAGSRANGCTQNTPASPEMQPGVSGPVKASENDPEEAPVAQSLVHVV